MSHYTEVEVEFDGDHIEEMIASLEEIFGKGHVEYHKDGVPLMGYQGDDRSKLKPGNGNYAPPCEVVIRRKHVGGASNDVGFKLQQNGKFKGYISDYDSGYHFGKEKQNKVASSYALSVGEKMLRAKGYGQIERIKMDDGSVKLVARPNKVQVAEIKTKNW